MADITNLKDQYKNLSSNLQDSPTAYSGSAPTSQDISTQKKMIALNLRIERAKSADLNKNFYGDQKTAAPDEATTGVKKKGVIGRALQVLSAPMHLGVGAIEGALGKGQKPGVIQSAIANLSAEENYGDLLRKVGVQGAKASVLGFALDVALDPVNWATAGTAALIPRIGKGLMKGGLKGMAEGATSGLLKKATTLAAPVKWVGATEKYGKLALKAAESSAKYDKTIGFDLATELEKGGALNNMLSSVVEGIKQSPVGSTFEHFLYSTRDWYAKSKVLEDLTSDVRILRASNPDELRALIRERSTEILDNPDFIKTMEKSGYDIRQTMKERVKQSLDAGGDLATLRPDLGVFHNSDDAVDALTDEFINDLALRKSAARLREVGVSDEEALGIIRTGKEVARQGTGVEWYDKLGEVVGTKFKIGDVNVGKKIVDGYKTAIDLFKIQKIGSPSTIAYSILGNMVMAGMSGLDTLSKPFLKTLYEGQKWARGKPTIESLMSLMENKSVRELSEKYPETFRKTFGFNPKLFLNDDSVRAAVDDYSKLNRVGLSDKQKSEVTDAIAELTNQISLEGRMGKAGAVDTLSPFAQVSKASAGDIPLQLADTTAISAEFGNSGATGWIKKLKDIADNPSRVVAKVVNGERTASTKAYSEAQRFGAKALHWYLTKPIGAFEKVDQSFKIGNFLHLVRDGISENEVRRIGKWAGGLKSGQDVFIGADGLYRFSADKAAEISNEIFMNYKAMPGAVKVMRSMPFFGSPFFSFSYAMMAKTGKAVANNPAFLNKVQFALKELGGGKSPLEKDALANNKYYQWLNKDGMVSLPWFRQNPIYLNLANFIPYYTMSIFQPSDRTYTKNLQGGVAQLIDSIPFFKTPEGQVFVDYFLMPHLMSQSNPEGSFGQPLYPSDASGLEKNVLYPLRGIAEAVVPPVASSLMAAPIAVATAGLSDEAMRWLPSYRARQLGFAGRGKSSLGVISSAPALSKVIQAAAATYLGVSYYPMDLRTNK